MTKAEMEKLLNNAGDPVAWCRLRDAIRALPDPPAVAGLVAVCQALAAAKSQQDVWDIQPKAIAALAEFPEVKP